MYPEAVKKLIEQFERLPGIGPKAAERFTFFLLEAGRGEVERLRLALEDVLKKIKSCSVCQNFSEKNPCVICSDPKRSKEVICVVAQPSTVESFEKNGNFNGTYHVLRGLINSSKGKTEDDIKIAELVERIKSGKEGIKEIIIALNPDIDGETTALAVSNALKPLGIKVSKLARGIPIGADLEYADEITLSESITGRKQI